GDALDDVVEFHLAGLLGENGHVVRIPLDEGLALLDLATVLDGDNGADDDGVNFEFAAVLVEHLDGAVLVQDDVVAVLELDDAKFVVTNGTVVLGLDGGLLELAGGNTAGVERAHGELRAGLADGLRGDDADSLAELDERAGGKVATVAV